jgi:ion channel
MAAVKSLLREGMGDTVSKPPSGNSADWAPGLLYFPLIVVAVVSLGVKTYGTIKFGYYVFSIAVIIAIGALHVARSRGVRSRIVALLVTYLCIVAIFGSIYYILFCRDVTAFAFAANTSEGKAVEHFSRELAHYRQLNEEVYVVELLDSNINITLELISSDVKRQLDSTHTAQTYTETSIDGESQVKVRWLQVMHGSQRYRFGAAPGAVHSRFESERLTAELFDAKSRAGAHKAIVNLLEYLLRNRLRSQAALSADLRRDPRWEFLDFCYFSVVTMTTVGYGDIVPNNSVVRLCVTAQAVIGVAFVAYALIFLWPTDVKPR